ncbi:MAG: protein BatD, partial [Puniceicoccaceae bacterium]
MLRTFFRHFIVLAILIASASAEITVSAVFNPPRVAQGDTARYIVEIKETSTQQQPQAESVNSLPIPQAGGLELLNGRTSTSTQTRIVNGAAEYSVSQQLIIDARASGVGRYSIPSYTFEYKGDTYRVPAATLEVIERPADAGPTVDELIFLKTDAPEKLYLGQTTPIQLKLYISEAVRLSGLNRYERNTDGFTVSDLPDSQESSEIYQGHRYRVLTWPLMITPIRSGPQGLDFEFSVTASLPGQNNRNDPFGRRGFGSSIFDDFFGRAERFTVYTEPTEIEVLPLPTANRPNSFTGAIGEFSLQIYTDHPSTEVGEPIMLSLEISGQGNFDRINGPTPPEGPDWRSYAPEARFQPRADNTPTRGTKRFDYMLIPQRAGALLIPEMKFAYFDPESKSYVELVAPPIEISVRPSNRHALTQALPPQGSSSLPLPQQMSTKEALLTLDYRPKPPSNRLDAP